MAAIVHRNLRLEKSVRKKVEKSFIQKKDIRFRHLQLYLWEWRLFDNYICFFCSFDENVLSFQIYWVFSILCDIWIGLFDVQCGVIFLKSLLLSIFGVLWRPRSRRGSCQIGYIVPESLEPPIWCIRIAVSIICKLRLSKAILSVNLIHVFYPFDWLVEEVQYWRLLLLMLNDSAEKGSANFQYHLYGFMHPSFKNLLVAENVVRYSYPGRKHFRWLINVVLNNINQSHIKHRKHWWIFDVRSMFHQCFQCFLHWNQRCSVY